MLLSALHGACLVIAAAWGAEEPAGPVLKAVPDPIPAARKPRHFVVQLKLVEVDEQGRETVLGEPQLQTTGGNAGISIDHPDGRRFEFTVKVTDRLGTSELEELPVSRIGPAGKADTVQKKLERKIDLQIEQQPRGEVLREVSRRADVRMAIDPESLRAIVADMESPIDLKVKDQAVSAILKQLIEPLNLGYTIKHDVVLIAAVEKLAPGPDDFVVKSYSVADLVRKPGELEPGESERAAADFAPLIDRIKSSVMPESWEGKESAATIRPFNSTRSIIVRQTVSGHAAIARLLETIRREQSAKIPD